MKIIVKAKYILMVLALAGLIQNVHAENWVAKLSDAEFQDILQYVPPLDYKEPPLDPAVHSREFPEVFDWREMNGVTPVKSQGQCGSCWAFTATAVLESKVYIDTGEIMDFSEQQLVDCVPNAYGCHGGNYDSAWEYLQYPGFMLEEDYPYMAQDMSCRDDPYETYIRVTGWEGVNSDTDAIKAALMDYGPVATVMGANGNLQYYSGGCYSDDANTQINHGVVIVGWDDTLCEGGSWIVKNSWGSDWGDNGFFYIRRGDVHIGEYAMIVYYEEIPAVRFELVEHRFNDSNTAVPEPGETVEMNLRIKNIGREEAKDISVTVTCDNDAIIFLSDHSSMDDLSPKSDDWLEEPIRFRVGDILPGENVVFHVQIVSGEFEGEGTVEWFVGPLFVVYKNDFEGETDEGWVHGYTRRADNWMRGIQDPEDDPGFDPGFAHSGTHVWGNSLNKGGGYIKNCSNYLLSPKIDCSGMNRVFLTFWRWLSVEESRYDQAKIWINDDEIWVNPYEGHLIDRKWTLCKYDISSYVAGNPIIQVKFTLDSDEGLNFGGWNIDDIQIVAGIDDTFLNRHPGSSEIHLELSKTKFSPGDLFQLDALMSNFTETPLTVYEFIILDVDGALWYWPSWTPVPDYETVMLSPRQNTPQSILSFEWPDVAGHRDDMRFWGANFDETLELLSYDLVTWGW